MTDQGVEFQWNDWGYLVRLWATCSLENSEPVLRLITRGPRGRFLSAFQLTPEQLDELYYTAQQGWNELLREQQT